MPAKLKVTIQSVWNANSDGKQTDITFQHDAVTMREDKKGGRADLEEEKAGEAPS